MSEHTPTIEQLAARVVDYTMEAAKAEGYEMQIRYRESAAMNLIDLIQRMISEQLTDCRAKLAQEEDGK